MKVLLTTLNSKYAHSSLALRYLKKYCSCGGDYILNLEEYTINEALSDITADIYKKCADVVIFSCYIWNISETLIVADRLKKVKNDIIIILGGPEVSYDSIEILKSNEFIDYVIKGEGEETLKELLNYLKHNLQAIKECKGNNLATISSIKSIVYRDNLFKVFQNKSRPLISSLETIPFPYDEEDLKKLSGKIIYYEASRGCPFNCSYCLSSTTHGIRYLPLDRVKRELQFFIANGVKLVKFVDRTFNADKKRTFEIFEFLVQNKGTTKFHFEISADLLDEETIKYLTNVPEGLFQFEIGVQSTNKEVLKSIDRHSNLDKLKKNIKQLRSKGNVHLHLDLIAGLPNEDLSSFRASFDEVMSLEPHVLQLGFLKLLKGSRIRDESKSHGYEFISEPPYEILKSSVLSFDEIILLKSVEDVLEKYYNSGAFQKSLEFMFKNAYSSYFDFFKELAFYFSNNGLNKRAHSQKALYDILYEFYISKEDNISNNANLGKTNNNFLDVLDTESRMFKEYLKFDFINNQKGSVLPYWANDHTNNSFRNSCFEFLKNKEILKKYLSYHTDETAKNLIKIFDFGIFSFEPNDNKTRVFLFDRTHQRYYDITEDWIMLCE